MKVTCYLIAAAAALVLAGCNPNSSASTSVEHLNAKPTTAQVAKRDIVGYLLLDGRLVVPPDREAVIHAPYASNVDRVLVKQGDHIGKGETILTMKLPEYEQYFEQAKAALQAAQSAYNSADAQYGNAYHQAQKALDQARANERRARQTAGQTGDATALNVATEERQRAEQQALQAKADRDAQLLPYKQQLDQAQGTVKDARAGVRQANVNSPISGTIVDLTAQPGAALDNTTTVAKVVDLSDIQVKADLTPDQAPSVDDGNGAIVIFDGIDKPFSGSVTRVQTLPASTGSVKREVTVDFSNDDGVIKPGMTVKAVGIKIGKVEDALAVPAAAIFRDANGKSAVRIQEKGAWTVREVQPGLSDGFFTEIKSGLNAGDVVRVPGES